MSICTFYFCFSAVLLPACQFSQDISEEYQPRPFSTFTRLSCHRKSCTLCCLPGHLYASHTPLLLPLFLSASATFPQTRHTRLFNLTNNLYSPLNSFIQYPNLFLVMCFPVTNCHFSVFLDCPRSSVCFFPALLIVIFTVNKAFHCSLCLSWSAQHL